MLTLESVKRDLRIYHDHDDDLLREYIAAAHAEALNFCNLHSFSGDAHAHIIDIYIDRNNHLIFVFSDNSYLDAGLLPTGTGGTATGGIDGGRADSVYTVDQIIDGGGA